MRIKLLLFLSPPLRTLDLRDFQLSVPKASIKPALYLKYWRGGFCTAWAGLLRPSEVDMDVFCDFFPPLLAASLFTLCLPGVSAQLLNGFALSATVQSPVRLFKKALTAPLPSSERDWEEDSQRVPTNKKPGGIRVRIVLRVPAAQTSKLQGSTLVFVPWVVEFLSVNLHPSHRVSCIKSVFSSCAPWMPPVCTLRKPQAVWTILKFKIAMFIQ